MSSTRRAPTSSSSLRGPAPNMHPNYFKLFLHVGAAAQMAGGFLGLGNLAVMKAVKPQYGGFFQYLTILGLIGSGIAMLAAGFSDLVPAASAPRMIKRFFLLFAMPVEIVIASIYWSIVLVKPDLMFPPNPDAPVSSATGEPTSQTSDLLFRIPLWMDLSMHLLPAVALILEFFVFEKRYKAPASTVGAALLAITFGSAYSLWIEHTASINGNFPYPFLNVMDGPARVVLYIGATLGALATFRGLNALHR